MFLGTACGDGVVPVDGSAVAPPGWVGQFDRAGDAAASEGPIDHRAQQPGEFRHQHVGLGCDDHLRPFLDPVTMASTTVSMGIILNRPLSFPLLSHIAQTPALLAVYELCSGECANAASDEIASR